MVLSWRPLDYGDTLVYLALENRDILIGGLRRR